MKVILRPIPVVYACRGCELDAAAQRTAARLERQGEAEAGVMGKDTAKARSRFPIYVIEGCAKCCATQWLGSIGVRPQRTAVLNGDSHQSRRAELFPADGE
ncbi:MAG TPA: putative zinc-binding protein [Burkholderiales bacterium]